MLVKIIINSNRNIMLMFRTLAVYIFLSYRSITFWLIRLIKSAKRVLYHGRMIAINNNNDLIINSPYGAFQGYWNKQWNKWNIAWLKIPTGMRRTSWRFYKCGQGFELGATKNNLRSGWDLNLGPPNYKSSALSTRPRCLLTLTLMVVYTEVFQTSVTITNSPINS